MTVLEVRARLAGYVRSSPAGMPSWFSGSGGDRSAILRTPEAARPWRRLTSRLMLDLNEELYSPMLRNFLRRSAAKPDLLLG